MATNSEDDEEAVRPVIIIKRVDDDHDDHHGGVWKIAFADFMTAMMAFFLVMWLINAANEETKAQVASYFNPVKLTDAVLAPKGVSSTDAVSAIEVKPEDADAKGDGPSDDKNTKASKSGTKAADTIGKSDEAMFKDPYQTLNKLAGEIGSGPSAEDTAVLARDKSGSKDSDTFRDPFDPEYRSKISQDPLPDLKKKEVEVETKVAEKEVDLKVKKDGEKPKSPAQIAQKMAQLEIEKMNTIPSLKIKPAPPSKIEKDAPKKDPSKKDVEVKPLKPEAMKKEAVAEDKSPERKEPAKKTTASDPAKSKLERQERLNNLKKQLAKVVPETDSGKQPNLTVEQTDAGLLVSLTDTFGFEMFSSASAKPTVALIKLLDRISPILKKQKGPIVVRGHTDARPFKSDSYDNWRLSTARAHMARHMLIRGGMEGDRIVRIEGHADRHLKNRKKPFSAENRRIEVLIVDDEA